MSACSLPRALPAALLVLVLAPPAAQLTAAPASAKRLPGLEQHLSAQELATLHADGLSVAAHQCGCYDKPDPHFPYTMLIVRTPERELIVRPEGQESAFHFELLAVRRGDTYCGADAEAACYGEFATPCEFTDFRYGPVLKEYFPTCKLSSE